MSVHNSVTIETKNTLGKGALFNNCAQQFRNIDGSEDRLSKTQLETERKCLIQTFQPKVRGLELLLRFFIENESDNLWQMIARTSRESSTPYFWRTTVALKNGVEAWVLVFLSLISTQIDLYASKSL